MSAEPLGTIRVVKLAHGYRVDMTSIFPGGEAHQHPPEHWPTHELAERFAEMMAANTGFEIEGAK